MSTTITTASAEVLADRVHTTLVVDDPPLLAVGETYPAKPKDEWLTSFELDCRDWGLVYGFAYGIARGEDPYESADSVARRALEAAKVAWARYGNDGVLTEAAFRESRAGDRPKSMADAIQPVMDAYERARLGGGPAMSDELATELDTLAMSVR